MHWMVLPILFFVIIIFCWIGQKWFFKSGKKLFGLVISIFGLISSTGLFLPYTLNSYRKNFNPDSFSLGPFAPYIIVFLYVVFPIIIMGTTLVLDYRGRLSHQLNESNH